MKMIIGLGNPGKEYDGTRHNIGREVVRALAEEWKVNKKLHTELTSYINPLTEKHAIARISGMREKVFLALPTTYMNDSGKTVKALATNYKLQTTNFLIVHDDLDLPLGTLRFSKGSGAAGQKGVQSIIDALGTKDFARLRIGVAGTHRRTTDAADYVLKKFSKEEQPIVIQIKKRATEALTAYCAGDLASTMNIYNK